MRDKIKDSNYFNQYIKENTRVIEKYENMRIQLINERGADDPSIERVSLVLSNNYINRLNCFYSIGESLEEIKKVYHKAVKYLTIVWEKETSSYIQLLWLTSVGILLNEVREVQSIQELVKKEQFADYLIDYMLNNIDSQWEITTNNLAFPETYNGIARVIKSENKEQALLFLKDYLEKEWYQGHKEADWYNAHKNKFDTYSGYWSYESGAIAKILNLDDSSLKDEPYYPYDLVHYSRS
ncbi:PoNi-like cognate immunity protein [Listeria costaricensis]|uniref:PoNi-like cognate immunity protein n=1 Tax=Listeria costaricensis TaxID=2026604 RepID=UPI000C06AC78|nr:PoNi-like cognate immunity protein [Listeria costaricensis]